jgi:quinol monooxygenase YgiN
MMYGTIALMRPKAGQEPAVQALFEEWWTERRPNVQGAIGSTIYRNKSNPAELMVAVVFDSEENYTANANDPEQDRWYRRMVELLESEPRWIDGEILDHKHVWAEQGKEDIESMTTEAEIETGIARYLSTHRVRVLATNRRPGATQQTLIAYHFDGNDIAIRVRGFSRKAKMPGWTLDGYGLDLDAIEAVLMREK